jgi:hypothetical protein
LQSHKEEIKLFLNQNLIDIFLISETHFTTKNYFSIQRYKLYYTSHPDGTAHGGTAILMKETIEHYELLKYEEDSIQATSINPTYWPTDGKRIPDLLDFFVTNGISST